MKVGAVILAAGASRRLGRAKQLVEFGGEMLLARAVRLVREAGLVETVVVLGAGGEEIMAAVDLSGVRVVRNENWESGIAGSIHAGLRGLDADVDGVLILTCDQPRLSVLHLLALVGAFDMTDGAGIAASEYAGAAGVPAVFPRGMFGELYGLTGDKGAKALLSGDGVVRVGFPGGELDVDTPEDMDGLE